MSDEIKKVTTDAVGSKGINPSKLPPDGKDFQSFMQSSSGNQPGASTNASNISPMDLAAQNASAPTGASLAEISRNVASSDQHLNEMQKKLQQYPNLKFKRQHENLLKNKMQNANQHLKKMHAKMGIPSPESAPQNTRGGPVARFLRYVTDGQNNLLAAKARLEEMGKNTKQLNPANLLAVQIQAAQAQQNLEYSSILLSKVIESMKQMLNIQL